MSMVLVVEDDPFSRFTMTEMLDELGHATLCASSGEEALRLLFDRAQDIGVVLLDIHMPGVSGAEVVRALRRSDLNPPRDLPVLAVSADPLWQSQARVRAAGCDIALPKPVSLGALKRALSRVLAP
ncbi:response regulator [Rhodovulum sp. DZ06]|uniref:response regulator n=1 Tax=Rhodovulum sp. DZ06 TaxID=3425126 RepID=UPI003D325367